MRTAQETRLLLFRSLSDVHEMSTNRPLGHYEEHTAAPHHPLRGEAAPTRTLTFFNGLAIVVGLQIGSGIFSSPATVATLVPAPILGVCVWLFAGLLVWTGAASFAELGVRCPDNGGMQEYLCYCFGDLYGFLFAGMWILVVKPCAMSMIAMVFAEYLYKGFAIDQADISLWVLKPVALLAIGLITYLNCMGTLKAANTANVFLVLKISTLGTIASLGFLAAVGGLSHRTSSQEQGQQYLEGISAVHSTPYREFRNGTDAVLAALFAYGGWESVGFVGGEVLDPAHNIPKIINRAILVVIMLFVLTITAFYTVIPLETLRGTNTIATVGSRQAPTVAVWLTHTGFWRRALRESWCHFLYMDGMPLLSWSPQCDSFLSWAPDAGRGAEALRAVVPAELRRGQHGYIRPSSSETYEKIVATSPFSRLIQGSQRSHVNLSSIQTDPCRLRQCSSSS